MAEQRYKGVQPCGTVVAVEYHGIMIVVVETSIIVNAVHMVSYFNHSHWH